MSLSSYFYDKCPSCGGLLENDVSPFTGQVKVVCTDCGKVVSMG